MRLKDKSSDMLKYLNLLEEEFNKNDISYTVEVNNEIQIWFDKENNFGCSLYSIGLDITHLDGSVIFNLDEGWEEDIANIPYIIDHILKIMSYDLYQIESYKLNKLCSVTQKLVIDNKRIACSSFTIMNILFFIPIFKKQIFEKHYRYNQIINKLIRINK
ncbi:MAG: hypothetical protein K0Q73_1167 [Paenibacillus sp.]|jgi:hypothetical protein|nr:hypothetical protein [Paenibacillus sp.]